MKNHLVIFFLLILSTSLASGQENLDRDTINTSAGKLVVTFIGHGSLLFSYQDRSIYIDPVMQVYDYSTMPRADAILITHNHGDHLDPVAIEKISGPDTEIYLSKLGFDQLKRGKPVKSDDFFIAAGIPVETVEAYNILAVRGNGKPYHPKGEGNGYVLTFGQTRLYVAGDTEFTPEMAKLKDIDIAFLPIGLPYTMAPSAAAMAAVRLKIKILYPYHFNTSNPEEVVRALVGSSVEVRVRSLK